MIFLIGIAKANSKSRQVIDLLMSEDALSLNKSLLQKMLETKF